MKVKSAMAKLNGKLDLTLTWPDGNTLELIDLEVFDAPTGTMMPGAMTGDPARCIVSVKLEGGTYTFKRPG